MYAYANRVKPGVEYDLHNHSDRSKDGRTPGRRLIDLAAHRGLRGLGICDHDEFPDESLYAHARRKGVRLALGIEFTCDKAHVIGFGLSPSKADRKAMEQRFTALRANAVRVAQQILAGLAGLGLPIPEERLRAFAGKEPQKAFIMKYLVEELGLFATWAEARAFLRSEGLAAQDSEGLPPLHPAEAVALIRRSGGVSVWAHPLLSPEHLREGYLRDMRDAGLDAVEAVYAYGENGYSGPESNAVLEARTLAMIRDTGLAVSGGSDSHYPVKTDLDRRPIRPGDRGITAQETEPFARIFA
ncbi:MAG: PHP domain-containing protein [Thermodesulfobacteriota bacterium]